MGVERVDYSSDDEFQQALQYEAASEQAWYELQAQEQYEAEQWTEYVEEQRAADEEAEREQQAQQEYEAEQEWIAKQAEKEQNMTEETNSPVEETKEEAQMKESPLEMREVRSFVDNKGHEVNGFFEFNLDTLLTYEQGVIYKGVFTVMSNRGPFEMTCNFPAGYKLEQCFEDFDQIALDTIEDKKKEAQEKSRIITPDQVKQRRGIITP